VAFGEGTPVFAGELNVCHNTVVSLGAQARHGGLPFGGPRDLRVAEEDTEARSRTPSVWATQLVDVGVGRHSKVRCLE